MNPFDWAKLILGLVSLLSKAVSYLEQRQLITAGQREAIADQLQRQADALKKAKASREAIRTELNTNPSRVLVPDKFTRSDDPKPPG
jgi:hypothetical protein